jgi:apolipoprotein N-acyltransferase
VQGNIAQADKWKASESRRIFTTHLAMTRDVVRRGAEFVIWPESSTPFMYEEDEPGRQAIVDVVRELRTPLLFGTEQLQRGARPRLYNAAYLIAPSGDTAAVYHKMRLVPFGEYVPMKQVLSFVSPLVERMLDFSAGESVTLLPVGGLPVSTAICYEVVYPWLAREAVAQGSQLLTTITNDGWYGQSSAPYQHFDMAAMRAIEQGRYLARAANTGVSGVIDPYGRVLARSAIFEEIGLVHPVRLLTRRTIYSQVGDVVPYASMAMLVLAAVLLRRAPRVR